MSERTRVYGVTLAAAAAVCPVRPLTRVSVALLSSIFGGGLFFVGVRARVFVCRGACSKAHWWRRFDCSDRVVVTLTFTAELVVYVSVPLSRYRSLACLTKRADCI